MTQKRRPSRAGRAPSPAKRAAILEAATAAFLEAGFERASMEAIARAADVSTATLYRHFSAKTDLFEAVAGAALARFGVLEDGAQADPLAAIEALAVNYARLLCDPTARALFRMLVGETDRQAGLGRLFYDSVKSRLGDAFAGAVARAGAAGAVREVADAGLAAGQLQGMIEHATLLRGLILGDAEKPLAPPEMIAAEAFRTWVARWRS